MSLSKLATAGVVTAAAAALAAAPLTAKPLSAPGSLTFNGQCQLAGSVQFDPLLTLTPGVVHNRASATGTCSGTLTNGRGDTTQLTNAPVSYSATEVGTQESCELNADAPGSGELVFSAGALKFAILENRVAGTALLSLTGSQGGSATAVAAVNSPNPATVLEQCAGSGEASVPVDLTLQTTPAISG